jgi:hypothetical protein
MVVIAMLPVVAAVVLIAVKVLTVVAFVAAVLATVPVRDNDGRWIAMYLLSDVARVS